MHRCRTAGATAHRFDTDASAANAPTCHNHLIKFFCKMVPRTGGKTEARGLDIFVLDEQGKIQSSYQFGEPLPV
jgi:hypothetical protein